MRYASHFPRQGHPSVCGKGIPLPANAKTSCLDHFSRLWAIKLKVQCTYHSRRVANSIFGRCRELRSSALPKKGLSIFSRYSRLRLTIRHYAIGDDSCLVDRSLPDILDAFKEAEQVSSRWPVVDHSFENCTLGQSPSIHDA